MTQRDFTELYKQGRLNNVSIWHRDEKNRYGETIGQSEMVCFTYNDTYYIRISQLNGLSRHYHEELRASYIKEFTNKNSANRYFSKVKKSGYIRHI